MIRRAAMSMCAALLLAACPGGDDSEPTWSVALDGEDLNRVALSVWGADSGDAPEVYVVGGSLGSDLGALAIRYDGATWSEISTGSDDTFWWVWGAGTAAGDVWFVGENGAIYRHNDSGTSREDSQTALTLFGVWGASAQDVWVVGGDPLAAEATAIILHNDGTGWTDVTPALDFGGSLFKVWGSSASDVWACGQGGTLAHYDGSGWSLVDTGTRASLFTVAGSGADDVWAVGGAPAVVLHRDASGWSTVDTGIPASILNGVTVGADGPAGDVLVVGMGGVKLRFRDGVWTDETSAPPNIDLHAAWTGADGTGADGGTYVVGGNFYAPASPGVSRVGVVGYYGTAPPADSL